MIFVTVGNMDPFDRLVRAVDAWAGRRSQADEILMQIGSGRYHPEHCQYVNFLTPIEFRETFARSHLVISHAGMGTIITALELSKPLVVMPKRASLGEQRNEHQLATVRRFRRSSRIRVAESDCELAGVLDSLAAPGSDLAQGVQAEEWRPDPTLIAYVREFVSNGHQLPEATSPATQGAAL